MKSSGLTAFLMMVWVLTAGLAHSRAAATNTAPDFKEVYDLIRANAAGVTDADLNRAAVQGVLTSLRSKVWLASNAEPVSAAAGTPVTIRCSLFDDGIAYLRIPRVDDGLARELERAYRQSGASNQLKGLVLDLRYADGADYAAAAAAADLFLAKARPLLNWGDGVVSSHEKTNAIQLPVVVLVNRDTTGAAEAFASVLRASGVGLILGGKTAGRAMMAKSFPLKTGGELRVATTPIALGDGSAFSADGVKPDIEVAVRPEDERAYFEDAFYAGRKPGAVVAGGSTATAGGTNAAHRVRFNEAELVREHREGMDRDAEGPVLRPVRAAGAGAAGARADEPDAPLVSDPVLARALDLLKGLAVVRQSRS